jgi:hypothetical protein
MRGAMRQTSREKARLGSKLAEIREALIAAGYNSAAKQGAVLGLSRSTAWAILNSDKRAGPTAIVIKRILSSQKIPPEARRKVEEYVVQKICGLYGHNEEQTRAFRDKLDTLLKTSPVRLLRAGQCKQTPAGRGGAA